MRAARFHEYGGPESLVIERAPDPTPGPVRSVSVSRRPASNPIDWKLRAGACTGWIPVDLPAIPGRDAVGVVDEIGDGVQG